MMGNKYIHIGSKFNNETATKIRLIAQYLGFKSPYKFVQVFFDCIIRFLDTPTEICSETKKILSDFDNNTNIRTITTDKPDNTNHKQESANKAVYFIGTNSHENCKLVLCQKIKDTNNYAVNFNVDKILEFVIKNISSSLHSKLLLLMKTEQITSITYMINKMCDALIEYECYNYQLHNVFNCCYQNIETIDKTNTLRTSLIAAKFSEEGYNKIVAITKRLGFVSAYDLEQVFFECLVRYFDNPQEGNPFFIQLLSQFENLSYWTSVPIISNMTHTPQRVKSCLYLKNDNKKLILCQQFEDTIKKTCKTDNIYTSILLNISPTLFKKIKFLMNKKHISSFDNFLNAIYNFYVNDFNTESDVETIKKMFSDNENSFITERCNIPKPELNFKRIHHRNMEVIGKLECNKKRKNNKKRKDFLP